ncbi:sigma-70 family RNA polymerase sigma factor, partial [Candidatus Woesearchaeota archaeon]|nr:sigma-70 family RNA polymerase sigma factor [Candidatus Woesearchaeota archaeon]
DVAKEYQNSGVPMADLIGCGNLGYLEALRRFDEDRKVKLITYAVWWIRQAIRVCIAGYNRTISLPVNKVGDLYRIGKVIRLLQHERGNEGPFSDEEIANRINVLYPDNKESYDAGRVRDAIEANFKRQSLDAPSPEENDGDRTLLDILRSEDSHPDFQMEVPPDQLAAAVIVDSERRILELLEAALDPRESVIIRGYYGIGGAEPLTLQQLGDNMSLTRERVRQLRERALVKLRWPENSGLLAELGQD